MVLRTEGLVKRYGKRTVVNDVSIDVRRAKSWGCSVPTVPENPSFYMTTGLIVPNAGNIYPRRPRNNSTILSINGHAPA